MARPYVFSADTTLYHPAEPEGRVFPKGSTDPGAAWSDNPGGDRSESKSVAGMVKDLVEANDRADALAAALTRNASDLAEMGKVRDEAVTKADGLAQRVADAEKAKADAEAIAAELTQERDAARAEASRLNGLLQGLDKARAEAVANAELYAEDNGKLAGRITDLEAEVAKVDGDGDGKVGGRKSKPAEPA